MEDNPYRAPEADLGTPAVLRRSIFWKIYFFFTLVLVSLSYTWLIIDPASGIAEYIAVLLSALFFVGFFGFVFSKPILKPKVWLIALFGNISYSFLYYFITKLDYRAGLGPTEFIISQLFAFLIFLPSYIALYLYSKPQNEVWNKTAPRSSTQNPESSEKNGSDPE